MLPAIIIGTICAFTIAACIVVGLISKSPPPPDDEPDVRRVIERASDPALVLYYVGERASHRLAEAERDWDRLCIVVLGHKRCGCCDCDRLAEVALDARPASEVAAELSIKHKSGEAT